MSTALVELRRYTLHPGRRDELIALFMRELVHTQEAAGLQVLATYADAGAPDDFVWLRGFPEADPQARGDALAAFYGGPAWAEHADAANATMRAFDDVHLLRPLGALPAPGDATVTTCLLSRPPTPEEERALPEDALVSARIDNRFPRLPVRAEPAVVWFGDAAVPPFLAPLLLAPPHVATLTSIAGIRS